MSLGHMLLCFRFALEKLGAREATVRRTGLFTMTLNERSKILGPWNIVLALDTIIRLGRSWNAVNSSDMIVESILASEDFRAVFTL